MKENVDKTDFEMKRAETLKIPAFQNGMSSCI